MEYPWHSTASDEWSACQAPTFELLLLLFRTHVWHTRTVERVWAESDRADRHDCEVLPPAQHFVPRWAEEEPRFSVPHDDYPLDRRINAAVGNITCGKAAGPIDRISSACREWTESVVCCSRAALPYRMHAGGKEHRPRGEKQPRE